MNVKFIKPRQGFGYFAGDIAELDDDIAKKLQEEGFVVPSETPIEIDSDLPVDLPGRKLLIEAGLHNTSDVLAASETLTDIKGISKAMSGRILEQLKN